MTRDPREREHGAGREMGSANVDPSSMNPPIGVAVRDGRAHDRTFRCADAGNADCRWEVTGHTEDELMPHIERHAREQHGMNEINDQARSRIRNAIRERAA